MTPGSAPRPNLQKIADAAGVSRMTVSMALRNDPRVATATRERIAALAARLGYRPNPLVSALMTHIRSSRTVETTTTIVFLTGFPKGEPVHEQPIFHRYFIGTERRAEQLGYQLENWTLGESGMTGKRLSHILWSRGIQALLLGPQLGPHPLRHLRLDWQHFACATFDYALWKPELHRVASNHFLTMTLLLRQLRRLGYRRAGLVLENRVDGNVNNLWLAAYLASQSRECPDPARRVPPLSLDGPPTASTVLPPWLDRHQPDVVVGMEDHVPGLLRATGRRVPEDIGFASLDLHHLDGRCAGMDQHFEELGAAAIDLIDGQMRRNERGVPDAPLLIQVGSTWKPGATVVNQRVARGPAPADSAADRVRRR